MIDKIFLIKVPSEAIIIHEGDSFRTCTFLEFRGRYEAENSPERQWLKPASQAIQSLHHEQMEKLLATLMTEAKLITEKTGIDSLLSTQAEKLYKQTEAAKREHAENENPVHKLKWHIMEFIMEF